MSKPKNIILENGSANKYEISSKIMKIKILASQILKTSSLIPSCIAEVKSLSRLSNFKVFLIKEPK
jgi:hypothetical protein